MVSVFNLQLPVTSLILEDHFLYSAQGGTIKVFDITEKPFKLVESLSLFKRSVIHGQQVFINDGQKHIIAFGGKDLSLIRILKDGSLEAISFHQFDDWILDVVIISPHESSTFSHLAIALAHNSVVLYNLCKSEILEEVHCIEKCILYSAHFVRQHQRIEWDNLILCSGTVFNQIVLWKPSCQGADGRSTVLQRISGHDGVIFDIFYDLQTGILLTASDDRSIRVWSSGQLQDVVQNQHLSDLGIECLCVMYGHEARIWKVEMLQKGGEDYIVSIAEDGFCILWKLNLSGDKVESHIVKRINCSGNILSLAIDNKGRCITGGCDGSIRLLDMEQNLQAAHCRQIASFPKGEFGVAKAAKLLTRNQFAVLVHTDTGQLLKYSMTGNEWTVLQRNNNYGSYAIFNISDEEEFVAIGNTQGLIQVLQLSREHTVLLKTEFSEFNSKVLNLTWFHSFLFVSGPNGMLIAFKIQVVDDRLIANKGKTFTLPQAKHRWHTAIFMTDSDDPVLVCGDRRGSLHMFCEGSSDPIKTYHGIHGKLGVTSLHQFRRSLVSTGRDGHWREWKIEKNGLVLLRKQRAAQGMDWIEGCNVIKHGVLKNLLIYGFRGNKFLVWSKLSGDELFSVLCGGGHRSWDFSAKFSKFIFLKAGQLNVVELPYDVTEEPIVNCGFHNQQINCVRHLARLKYGDRTVQVVATCGEDTKVLISAYTCMRGEKTSELQIVHVIDDHLSNVRAADAYTVEEDDFTIKIMLVTAGGRSSLNLYVLTLFKELSIHDFCDVEHIASYDGVPGEGVETRLMAVVAWKSGDDQQRMALACSDGRVRCLKMNEMKKIELLSESKEYQHCFLTIRNIRNMIVTGSTNGNVYFMKSSMDEVTSFKCHQSGINAIACCDVNVDRQTYHVIATGGDDNATCLLLLRFDSDVIKQEAFHKITNAHSAQITGLHWEGDQSGLRLLSTSIDQRLICWSVHISSDLSIDCQQVWCSLVQVADVSGMDACGGDYFICGRGLSHCVAVTKDA